MSVCLRASREILRGNASCMWRSLRRNSTEKTELPESADVVILGGGSLGCNTLYHLTKLGITNAVLLESNKLTAGTTWHTAGLLWRLRPSDTEIHLINTTRELLQRLEEETGVNPGWVNNGGLFIASSKERVSEYKRLQTIGRVNGVESHILSPSESKQLYPLMNTEDVYATLYCPGDGTMDPAGLCEGLTRYATRRGAKVIEGCPVTGINTSDTLLGGKKVTEVLTPRGNIKTNYIVNATGCWANDIASYVGITVPLIPMKHAYVVTERIPGIQHMPNIRDHDTSVYLRLQGDALAIGGYEQNPLFLDKLERDFAFGLYDLDWDVFGTHIQGAIQRVPCLSKTGIKSTVCGPESFTPDHKPVMGEDPTVQGFFHCCGFNSSGMMLGGGCGMQMAEWLTRGRPSIDMFSYDIRRFNTALNSNKSWVIQRSHESYAKNYSIVFPHDEPLAGRNMRKSPLHQVLLEQGCMFQERHGWERPGYFGFQPCPVAEYDFYGAYSTRTDGEDEDGSSEAGLERDTRYKEVLEDDYTFDFPPHHDQIRKEVMGCRERAAIFDMSYFGKYFLSGRDADKAADWLFTADMRKNIGTTVYTCMLNAGGGVEADLTVSVCEGGSGAACDPCFDGRGYYLAVGGAAALQNYAHITTEIRNHGWDVSLSDYSEDMALLSIQGRLSKDILQELSDEDFSVETFPFSTHRIITLAGHRLRALRLSFVGELGWELHVPSEAAVSVYSAIKSVGSKYGLVDAGYRAIDSLSCEKGYRHWHSDLRPDDSPIEAGLGFTCKLKTDINFLGRKALEERRRKGLLRRLTTFTLKDGTVPLHGLEGIKRNHEYVGYIRRAEYAFTLQRSIGYGYVERSDGEKIDKNFLSEGDYEIEIEGKSYPATLHLKPPFDPKNYRVKGMYEGEEGLRLSLTS